MATNSGNVERYGIDRFEGKDFNSWKFRVEAVLDQLDLKQCIDEMVSPDATEELKKNDKKCKVIIIQCISNEYLEYVKDKATSYEMWITLRETFERKGVASQLYLWKKLLAIRYNETETLETHFKRFDEIVRELKALGTTVDDMLVVCHLLSTLPRSFEGIVTALETQEPKLLTVEFVKSKLLDYNMKRSEESGSRATSQMESTAFQSKTRNFNKFGNRYNNNNNNVVSKKMSSNIVNENCNRDSKFRYNSIICYRCKKAGHKKSECRSRLEGKIANKVESELRTGFFSATLASASAAVCEEDCVTFIIDSGATEHMVNQEKYFAICEKLEEPVKIIAAKDGVAMEATKIGTIEVFIEVSNEVTEGDIKSVLLVNNLRYNLLSVSRLQEKNIKVVFNNDKVYLSKNGRLLAVGFKDKNLYKVTFQLNKNYVHAEVNACGVESETELWHKRFGHLGYDSLIKLKNENMVRGFNFATEKLKNRNCEKCIQSKQTQKVGKTIVKNRSSRPLQLIHTDICGPFDPDTIDGESYFLTFIDDFTGFKIVYLLRHKSEVFRYFREYEAYITAHFNLRISTIRCDRGGEYQSNQFVNFCKSKGIRVQYTGPYNPHLNGVAERCNRTITERARAMILESNLPKCFWGEAVKAATYVLNRSPTCAIKETKTPAEMFFGAKPDVSKLKVFGCLAYKYIPKQFRSKLDAKNEKCIFVGYMENGYRLWNPLEKKFRFAKNVIFDETKGLEDINLENRERKATVEIERVIPENLVEDNEILENETEKEEEVQENKRNRKLPERFKDYVVETYLTYSEKAPQDYEEAIESSKWKIAMQEEINSMKKNQVWELVERPINEPIIDCKWVYTIKNENSHDERYKARLVARGFMQRKNCLQEEIYSPVAKMNTIRLVLAVANQFNMKVAQLDVKTAFLNGVLDDNSSVYMEQPQGFREQEGFVCKLKKAIYGLKTSPKKWNECFNEFILTLGFKRSDNDSCLYVKINNGKRMYIIIYVDDLLVAATDEEDLLKLQKDLNNRFEMTSSKLHNFLGINIDRNEEVGEMKLNQKGYIDHLLLKYNMAECKTVSTPSEINLKLLRNEDPDKVTNKPYRELVGSLMYLALSTRPDIMYAINYLSRFQESPTENMWIYLKRILKYLKGTRDYCLNYRRSENKLALEGFADADFGNDPIDRKSITGFVFKVNDNIISWSSKKQSIVALSSTESEYIALTAAACEAIWLRQILRDLKINIQNKIVIYEDNLSAIALSNNSENTKRTKHIDVKFHYIKDKVLNGEIELRYIESAQQIADIFTKGLGKNLFEKHCNNLCLRGSVKK